MFLPNKDFEPDDLQEGLKKAAEPAKAAIEAVAPHKSGAYSRSILIVEEDGQIFLGSADPFAHLIEWGSVNNPAYAPIRRGITAAGLRLEET